MLEVILESVERGRGDGLSITLPDPDTCLPFLTIPYRRSIRRLHDNQEDIEEGSFLKAKASCGQTVAGRATVLSTACSQKPDLSSWDRPLYFPKPIPKGQVDISNVTAASTVVDSKYTVG